MTKSQAEKLRRKYNKIECDVFSALIHHVEISDYKSKWINERAIKINFKDYTELVYIHDRLAFHDMRGLQYGVYNDCTLEDLINLLNQICL